MNLFILDKNPNRAAKSLCDKHCIKLGLEAAQCLCTAFHLQNIEAPYRKTHVNHPVSQWSRESFLNFYWTLLHGEAILREYTARYGKIHKTSLVFEWIRKNLGKLKFDKFSLTPFALAMPDEFKVDGDPIQSYRNYYKTGKAHLHAWKILEHKPEWI